MNPNGVIVSGARVSMIGFLVLTIFCAINARSFSVTETDSSEELSNRDFVIDCEFTRHQDVWPYYACQATKLSIRAENFIVVRVNGGFEEGKNHSDVQSLHIANQRAQHLPSQMAKVFPNLIDFRVTNSSLEFIQRRNFRDLTHLKLLLITENPLKTIPSDTFFDLEKLEDLKLKTNAISSINPDTFSRNPSLLLVDLSYNRISSLSGLLLRNNLNLQNFLINNNLLAFIGVDLFSSTQHITMALFRGNSCIDEDFHSKNMQGESKESFLSHCQG